MADQASQRATIAASPEHLFEVVTDFERYPDWAHDLKTVEVVERDADGRATTVRYRAAAMGRSTTYSLGYDYADAPGRLSWRLLRGDIMRRLDGAYEFHAIDGDPDRTDVEYHLSVELVVPLPGFVKRRAESRIMHNALRELKAHVESTTAPPPAPPQA
jgi:ribosome-associated toxin RatA of RatAB toxin-antitoxin module